LDELAQVVASSGLQSSRLRGGRSSNEVSGPANFGAGIDSGVSLRVKLLVGAGVLGAIVCVVVGVWLAIAPGSTGGGGETATAAGGLGVPATAGSVVFLLDRGGASGEALSAIKAATVAAIESLGDRRRFAVLFWSNGQREAGYPGGSLAVASPEAVAAARAMMDDVLAFGQSDVARSFEQALLLEPDALVVISAKGFDLDEGWADGLIKARQVAGVGGGAGSKVVVHTVSVGTVARSAGLRKLAEATGGSYRELTPQQVRERLAR
jgi:hypothetical protein